MAERCMRARHLAGFLVIAAAAATPAAAQGGPFGFGGSDGPKWWGTVSGGYQWSNMVSDRATNSIWNFDSNWMVRASVEREVAPRASVGLGWSYSRMPVLISSRDAAEPCQPCSAEATIASYGVTLRSGGGDRGFHLVYEGFLGVLQYGSFVLDGVTAPLFRDVSNRDFAWVLGFGFGYAVARDFQIVAMYDYGNSVHERTPDLFQRRTTQHYSARVGVRVGM